MGKRTAGAIVFMIGLTSVTMGAAFFQQLGSGMAGFWRLEEAASPSLDSSGNGNTSSAWPAGVTSSTLTPAALGANSARCVDLNGTTGMVTFPTTGALNLTGDFTVCIWVFKRTDNPDWVRIIGKGAEPIRTFGVWMEPNGGGHILFQQRDPGGGYYVNFNSTVTIPLNQWTHIACRVSGTDRRTYINGASSGSATVTGPAATDASPVTIGAAGTFHSWWDGRLDDVRVYDRALADADIAAIAAGNQGPPGPSLTASYGAGSVVLNWSAIAGAVFNVKRSATSGGPYTTIASNVAGTTYTDTTATPYYYVVSGVTYGEGPLSNEGMPPVTALPNTGLFTSEVPTSTSFNVTFNSPAPAGGSVVQVTSGNTAEGTVSTTFPGATPIANGFQVNVAAATSPTIPVTVMGVNDLAADGPQPYTVTVTASGVAFAIPPVQVTNNDNDTPSVTISRTSGLVTTESGGADSFTVSLTTQPFGNITMSLTSNLTTEGTVSPGSITFTNLNWNTAQPVTLTGVDDALIDFTIPYTIVTGNLVTSDARDTAAYNGMKPPNVSAVNLDNETIPKAPGAWGSRNGGCGLLGLEIGLPLLLLGLWRRRRA